MNEKIVIGSRGSELARVQAGLVEKAIQAARPDLKIGTKIIVTKGDKGGAPFQVAEHAAPQVANPDHGRKGLFTAKIERALLAGDVDIAVHSAKDLPSETSPGAEIAAVLSRGPAGDVLVSKGPGGFASLPQGATIATGSVRRKHQLLWKRADLKLVDLRGNVPTRLRKLAENNWNAIVLARAGLERLGLSPTQSEINFEGRKFFLEALPCEIFLSAGGQGIIAMQIRADDERVRAIVDLVNDRQTLLCLRAERKFVRLLHGDCNSPVGVLATIETGNIKLRAQLFDQLSVAPREGKVEGPCDDSEGLTEELMRQINRLRA